MHLKSPELHPVCKPATPQEAAPAPHSGPSGSPRSLCEQSLLPSGA